MVPFACQFPMRGLHAFRLEVVCAVGKACSISMRLFQLQEILVLSSSGLGMSRIHPTRKSMVIVALQS